MRQFLYFDPENFTRELTQKEVRNYLDPQGEFFSLPHKKFDRFSSLTNKGGLEGEIYER